MSEQTQAIVAELRDRYAPTEAPPCRICGGGLSLERAGGGNPNVWRCTGLVEGKYAQGRKLADIHYEDSEWTDYKAGGDQRVIDICDALEATERRAEEAEDLYRSIKASVDQTPGDGRMVHDAIRAMKHKIQELEAAQRVAAMDVDALNRTCVESQERERIEAARADAAERRAEEAEAQAAVWAEWDRGLRSDFRGVTDDEGDPGRLHDWTFMDVHRPSPDANAGRALLDRLHVAEAERDALRAEVQRLRARVDAVGQVLAANGCECECGCFWDEHNDDCDLCLACRAGDALKGWAQKRAPT